MLKSKSGHQGKARNVSGLSRFPLPVQLAFYPKTELRRSLNNIKKLFFLCLFTASSNKYKVDLILQIYLKLPQSLTNLAFSGLLETSSVSIYGNTSGVDTISHFLLLGMFSNKKNSNHFLVTIDCRLFFEIL